MGIFSLFTSFDCFVVVEEDIVEGIVVVVATPFICLLGLVMELVVCVIVDSLIGNILVGSING